MEHQKLEVVQKTIYEICKYESFILELFILTLKLYCWCGYKNIKDRLLSNYLFPRAQRNCGLRDLRVLVNFYEKQCLPVITLCKSIYRSNF